MQVIKLLNVLVISLIFIKNKLMYCTVMARNKTRLLRLLRIPVCNIFPTLLFQL